MIAFLKPRWKIIAGILIVAGLLATFGTSLGIFIPILGTPIFLGALFLWYIPGIVFNWTGYFTYNEFGAAPNAWQGYAIMILFYLAIAVIISLPFGRPRT